MDSALIEAAEQVNDHGRSHARVGAFLFLQHKVQQGPCKIQWKGRIET